MISLSMFSLIDITEASWTDSGGHISW